VTGYTAAALVILVTAHPEPVILTPASTALLSVQEAPKLVAIALLAASVDMAAVVLVDANGVAEVVAPVTSADKVAIAGLDSVPLLDPVEKVAKVTPLIRLPT